ncbi:MAG: EutN/CcmL family microcompartment protein [Planctomycetota bacterium]|nr:EutN/CcmL family microcompartment protein [Planctomycetota bacterium]
MRIGKVIGTVTLCRTHSALKGASYRVVVPLSLANLQGDQSSVAEEFVVYDELGAGIDSLIAISEGGEAAQPFRPEIKPVDAYAAAILDSLQMD